MQDAYSTVNIVDSRIGQITSDLSVGVQTSGSNITAQSFTCNSASNSSIAWNIQLPSENTIVDRRVSMTATISFQLALPAVAAGSLGFAYGLTSALQSFPLNKLFVTSQCTLNNAQVQTNTQDIIDAILLMNDDLAMYQANSTTVTMPDKTYMNYTQASNGTLNNPLSSFNSTTGGATGYAPLSRGCFNVSITNVAQVNAAGNVVSDSLVSATATNIFYIWLSCRISEPLLGLPCFQYTDSDNFDMGMVGLNTAQFLFNIDTSLKRLFSTATTGAVISAQGVGLPAAVSAAFPAPKNIISADATLNFIFLSSQSTQLIPTKNTIPLLSFPRFLSNPAGTNIAAATVANGVYTPGVMTMQSPNISLNQLPDQFWIYVRIPMAQQTIQNSASFLTITNISMNLNNQSGLLSSYTQSQLYQLSREAGLDVGWTEWSGLATAQQPPVGNPAVQPAYCIQQIPTIGSVLVVPVDQLSLPDYLAGGSIGQFNMQFSVSVQNYNEVAFAPEIVVVTVNSGIMVTQAGSSQIFSGLLTKDLVLSTVSKPQISPMMASSYKRLVGGKLSHKGAILHPDHIHKHVSQKGGKSDIAMAGGISPPSSVGGKRHSKLNKHTV